MGAPLGRPEPDAGGAGSRDTMDRIRRVFVASLHLNMSEQDLPHDRALAESAGLDSLAALEFVTALEKEFGVTFEPELLRVEFVGDLPRLAAYIEERLASRRGARS